MNRPRVPTGLVGLDAVERDAKLRAKNPSAPTLNIPLQLGENVFNFGRALVVSDPEPVDGRPGFFARTTEFAMSGSAGTFVPVPVAGYLYGGGRRDTSAKVETILASSAPLAKVPASAEAVLAMKPHESVAIERTGLTKLFGGNMKCTLDESTPDGSWIAGGPIAADLTVTIEGETRTEIERGEGSEVTVRVLADTEKSVDGTVGAHVGFYLSWPGRVAWEVVRRFRDAEKTATEMAAMPTWREHTSGAFVGVSRGRGRSVMAELKLDLSKASAREAYVAAVRGDLEAGRRLAEVPGSGVVVDDAYTTDIQRRAVPVSFGLFGLGVSWDLVKERHETVGWMEGQPYDQTRDVDTKEKSTTGLDLSTHHRTATLDAITTRIAGAAPRLDARVGFTSTTSDPLTSKEELLEEIDFVRAMLDDDREPPELADYRAQIDALDPSRFMWVGPRDEGGKTSATIDVKLPRGAAQTLAAMPEQTLYATWAEVLGGRPRWIDPDVRARYDRESTDGRLDAHELSPQYLDRRADYFAARQVVRSLKALGKGTAHQRNRALRDFVGTGSNRRPRLALVGRLLDPDVSLSVDSNRGPAGRLLDFTFTAKARARPRS